MDTHKDSLLILVWKNVYYISMQFFERQTIQVNLNIILIYVYKYIYMYMIS